MKGFLNSPETLVVESLDGLVSSHAHLARLDYAGGAIKVVYNANHDPSKVSIISGGGSGHEPAFAGYVGEGMLAAAVAGEVFASPSEDAVLAAIRAVTGPAGCVLAFMNYTGDRLNFGMAAERAKAEGLKVEVVISHDDCALAGKSAVGRRGIAGSILVLKAAGAAAAAGAPLEEVKQAAEHAVASIGTMGCSMTVCNMPGQQPSDRLGPGEMEMGLGIHGEPGAYKSPVKPAREIVAEILARVTSTELNYLPIQPGERVGLMVNNLGSCTPLELNLAAKEAIAYVRGTLQARLERVWVGTFMTSLDMRGLSLSLIRLDDGLTKLLDDPAKAAAWPALPATYREPPAPTPVPTGPTDEVPIAASSQAVSAAGESVRRCIKAACEAVLQAEGELNALDSKVGDGDCGSTLAKGAQSVLGALDRLPADDLAATALAVAHLMGKPMGGTSGAVYKILLTAAAGSLSAAAEDVKQGGLKEAVALGHAMQAGVAAASKYGGAVAGSRTMLDALIPAANALLEAANAGASTAAIADKAASAAAEGAEATKHMAAAAGRSSYVPAEVLRDVPDPGAVAVARWLAGMAAALRP